MAIKTILSAASAALIGVGVANAATITFEGEDEVAITEGDSFMVGDVTFTQGTSDSLGFLAIVDEAIFVEAGTTKMWSGNRANVIMSLTSGDLFSLNSVDLGGSFVRSPARWADGITITGTLADMSTISLLIDLPAADPNYVNVVFGAAWSALMSVEFAATGSNGTGLYDYEFTLDNIDFGEASAVPLPAAAPLFLAGAAAAGFARRRRAKTA
ncbi:hypothetical protein [Parvularcula sp. LCG005]|uniref:hypothetical protein n=1 Tax=Parvularcula sp. LCG005 TaxID=3078805 RepID=UPI0029434D7D|nr:hypothetical protein [Parvularcula sp. LCG005]WOI54234.1 hypothetical protein RUI03_04360 [Parvularcula sp. LCG005]